METITHYEFQEALKIVHQYKDQIKSEYDYVVKKCDEISVFAQCNRDTKLWDVPCSTRLLNAIKCNAEWFGIDFSMDATLADFEGMSLDYFKKCRHVGVKSVQELKEMCHYAGVTLRP